MGSLGDIIFQGPLLLALPIALAAGFVAFAGIIQMDWPS